MYKIYFLELKRQQEQRDMKSELRYLSTLSS